MKKARITSAQANSRHTIWIRFSKTEIQPISGEIVVRREADPDVAVVENGVVGAVCPFDLVQRLRDQECFEAVARHEGKRALEEVEPPQRRKLVEHQEQPVTVALRL
ncbi:hypothetical protein GCM10019059_00180 [Camelimonas fluminis]|nr:hypothetical protein GCM10019059_00180 [Camelimonas fluminis]